jgi:DegV family protein with EDD domain
MQILTDRGADFSTQQLLDLDVTFAPLLIVLDDVAYRSGVDIQPDEFYSLLSSSDSLPTTSLPSAGEFAEIYREMAKIDPDILSIHISSGLSGTSAAAQLGAELVPEAEVTVIDTKTLSGAEGWQVEAAFKALKAGWSKEKIIDFLKQVSDATETLFTLSDLKYLIHGGRISHIKGLLAQALNIKPIIGVEKIKGIYEQFGQARTFSRAVTHIVDLIAKQHEPGTSLRVQIMHAQNPIGAEALREQIDKLFNVEWLPTTSIAPVLGAHTGPTLVGCVFAPQSLFAALP